MLHIRQLAPLTILALTALVAGRSAGTQAEGLLPVGSPAPAFTLQTPEGETVSLAKLAEKNKAVLVNFYFLG
jgi:hypothetical protein